MMREEHTLFFISSIEMKCKVEKKKKKKKNCTMCVTTRKKCKQKGKELCKRRPTQWKMLSKRKSTDILFLTILHVWFFSHTFVLLFVLFPSIFISISMSVTVFYSITWYQICEVHWGLIASRWKNFEKHAGSFLSVTDFLYIGEIWSKW